MATGLEYEPVSAQSRSTTLGVPGVILPMVSAAAFAVKTLPSESTAMLDGCEFSVKPRYAMLGQAPAGALEPLMMRAPTSSRDAAEAVPTQTSTPIAARRSSTRFTTMATTSRCPPSHTIAESFMPPTYPTPTHPTTLPPHAAGLAPPRPLHLARTQPPPIPMADEVGGARRPPTSSHTQPPDTAVP